MIGSLSDVDGDSHADDEKAKRKYAKRRDRRQTIISLLETISEYQRRSNAERNAIYFKNPFIVAMGEDGDVGHHGAGERGVVAAEDGSHTVLVMHADVLHVQGLLPASDWRRAAELPEGD